MSALRSSAGPAVCTNGTSSSAATICASDVLPRPGGPASSTWSSASPRLEAAAIETAELLAQRLLADELVQPPRAQRGLGVVVRAHVRGLEPRLDGVDGEHAGRADRLRAHRRASRRAAAIRSSGVSPAASRSSESASTGV